MKEKKSDFETELAKHRATVRFNVDGQDFAFRKLTVDELVDFTIGTSAGGDDAAQSLLDLSESTRVWPIGDEGKDALKERLAKYPAWCEKICDSVMAMSGADIAPKKRGDGSVEFIVDGESFKFRKLGGFEYRTFKKKASGETKEAVMAQLDLVVSALESPSGDAGKSSLRAAVAEYPAFMVVAGSAIKGISGADFEGTVVKN